MSKNKSTLIVILLLLGAGLAVWLSFSPAKGTIKVIENSDSIETEKKLDVAKDHSGQIFSFSYPGSYSLQSNSDKTSGFIDRVVLLGSGLQSKKITVASSRISADTLSDVPAVQSRRLKSDTYSESAFSLSGVSGIYFSRLVDTFELTGLVIKDDQLITISLTSNSTGPAVEKEYNDDFRFIVASWQWK